MTPLGAERVHGDGGLEIGVLAPVDENAALALRLLHGGDDEARVLAGEQLGDGAGERLGDGVRRRCVQRDIHLQALGAGDFDESLEAEAGEDVAQQEGNFGAGEDVGGLAGIEVEDDLGGRIEVGGSSEEGMDLEGADRGGPEETAGVLDQDVMNLRLAAAPPYRERLDPLWSESGRVFFVEELADGLVGLMLEVD